MSDALPDLIGEVIASISTEVLDKGGSDRLTLEFSSGRILQITSYPAGYGSYLDVDEVIPSPGEVLS